MFVRDRDFRCESKGGIVRCSPVHSQAISAYKTLQLIATKLLPQVPDAPPITVQTDGIIGPTTVLAIQVIAARLVMGPHRELAALATMQPEEAIPWVAERAMELAGYLDQVVSSNPTALIAQTAPEVKPLAESSGFTMGQIATAGVTLMGFVGIGLLAHASSKRSAGTMDRSFMLPESDGSDQFDGGDDDDGGDGGHDAGPDPEGESAHAA